MAYVTINWEYGDDSVIEGFRLYRDGLLRGNVESTIREFIDNVDDTDERIVKYEVKAFDSANRESYGCTYVDVRLMSIITPAMTSQNTPAGNCYITFSGLSDLVNDPGDGWKAFDRGSGLVFLDVNDGACTPGNWQHKLRYEFNETQRLSTWGMIKDTYGLSTIVQDGLTCKFKLYGSDDSGLGTLLSTMVVELGIETGTELLQDLPNPVYYDTYTVVVDEYSNATSANGTIDRRLYKEILFYDRPEIT